MSQASSIRSDGHSVLLNVSGDEMMFRDESVFCIVEWMTEELASRRYPQFTERIESSILIRSSDLTTPPTAGEAFKDSDGNYHRILFAKHDGSGWKCACTVERVTS